jgi:ubiquinone/menaquinone biosynthesis C-methylase UbiE
MVREAGGANVSGAACGTREARESGEYILGTDRAELDRLRGQHAAWTSQAYELFERAGLRAGERVLDLGCGPGFTSLELARAVGPAGRVIAVDKSERFLAHLAAERERHALPQVEPRLAALEELDRRDPSTPRTGAGS